MRTVDYINQLRKLTKTGSDYAVAKLLGISEDTINGYRKGDHAMSADIALLVAETLDLPPLEVLADAQLEHAKTPEHRARWAKLRKSLRARAAVALIAVSAAVTSQSGDARTRGSMSTTSLGPTPTNGASEQGRAIARPNNYATFWRTAWRAIRARLGSALQLPHPLRYTAP